MPSSSIAMRQSIDLRMSTGSVANTTRTDAGSENTTSPPQRDNEPRHVVDVGVHGEPQARSAGQHHLEQLRTQLRRDSYLHRLRLPGRLASAPVHSRLQRAQPQPALPRELLLRQPTRLERFDAPEPLLLPHRLRHARQGPRRRPLTQRLSARRLPDGYEALVTVFSRGIGGQEGVRPPPTAYSHPAGYGCRSGTTPRPVLPPADERTSPTATRKKPAR